MRLFLIRHGETVDNVAAVYAGITDSALTNHGVLQASRLGTHLAATGVKVAHIFSSDLQRAVKTAEAIRVAQSPIPPETTKLEVLREQDFGFYEGKRTIERPKDTSGKSGKEAHADAHRDDPGIKDVESKKHMRSRMETFVDSHLVKLLQDVQEDKAVVIVAHGIILNYLWRTILKQFKPEDVKLAPGVQAADRGFSLEYLGGWSNTGYLELLIMPKSSVDSKTKTETSAVTTQSSEIVQLPTELPLQVTDTTETPENESTNLSSQVTDTTQLSDIKSAELLSQILDNTQTSEVKSPRKLLNMSLVVKAVNSQGHLKGLKKTRGGLGSLKHDTSQKTMDSFFKKRPTE